MIKHTLAYFSLNFKAKKTKYQMEPNFKAQFINSKEDQEKYSSNKSKFKAHTITIISETDLASAIS